MLLDVDAILLITEELDAQRGAQLPIAGVIAVAMCNRAKASQNAYLALGFQLFSCPKRSGQSYISKLVEADELIEQIHLLFNWHE